MLSEHETQFHRSFLALNLCVTIWNEDYNYQNAPGGRPPDRQRKIESDPVYAYHFHAGPHWPSRPPGKGTDKKYNALLARSNGSLDPLVIITKRGMSGQKFASAATPWELTNSVMCGGKFNPVVNSMMEVTGHYANVPAEYLLHPKGINFSTPSEYMANNVPLYLWMHRIISSIYSDGSVSLRSLDAPEGWEPFRGDTVLGGFHGGIDVLVLPNGNVIGANSHQFQRSNGHAQSSVSPLDFWTPGSRLAAAAIRGLTNRVSAAAVKAFQALKGPTKELAVLSATRMAGKTLTGMAVSRGSLPVKHLGRRTIIADADLAVVEPIFATSSSVEGMYDVIVHANRTSFGIFVREPSGQLVGKDISVREVADAIGPRLANGDQIRLIACYSGVPGGPAQQLANTLNRTVWAPNAGVYARQGRPLYSNGKLIGFDPAKSFVPEGGVFSRFHPTHRGSATLAGKGRTAYGDKVQGEINPARRK